MGVPKRKKSRTKVRSRRNAKNAQITSTKPCPQCGAAHRPHRVCPSCGYYRGRQVTSVKAD